jgi:hypothetical protein
MLKHPYATEFKQAAQSEYDALVKRSTFTPILRSTIQTNVLPLLWVFPYKFDTDGYLLKFKARICVRGISDEVLPGALLAVPELRRSSALLS